MEVPMSEKFNYCVGRPWAKVFGGDGTSVSVYAYGTQVHYGTMEEAEGFREYVNKRTGEDNHIYKLVQVIDE